MNKKLLALAVAAAIAPAAAMADSGNVVIYGTLNMGFESVDNGTDAAGTAGIRTTRVTDNASFIGFKGTEDIGNGLKAVWQVESGLNAESGSSAPSTLASRNTFLGLNGGFGTVLLGKHDTPYKLATGKLDVFADSLGDYNAIMGTSAIGYRAGGGTANSAAGTGAVGSGLAGGPAAGTFDLRPDNVVAYITPTFSGFHAAVAYVAGAETADVSTDSKGNAYSLMGMYENGPFFASLAHEKHNGGSANTGTAALGATAEQKATKLGLGYNFGPGKVGLIYERTSDNLAAGQNLLGHNAWHLNGAYNFAGNNTVKLSYTKAGDADTTNWGSNSGAKMWALGVDHAFSKRTSVSLVYAKISNDDNAGYTFGHGNGNGGAVSLPGAVTTLGSGFGADPSGWAVSMKHSF